MAAIDYSLLIDWIGTSSAWYDDAEACWIPRGATSATTALVDLTGNGNDLTYDEYADSGWSAENGWAGVDGEYFDTGIVPQLEQTIYVAFTDAVDGGGTTQWQFIGARESISGTFRQHYLRGRDGTNGFAEWKFMDQSRADTAFRTDGVMAMNKNGFWLNGTELFNASISTSYTFTINLFLMALNNAGSAIQTMPSGYVAGVCIVNATDDDDTIKLRSHAMRNIINQNTAFPTVPIASFEDRLIWWNAKRGNDYYISPTGRGFEPKAIGRATFVLDNNDNELDPRNTSSSLYGYIEPGKLIQLSASSGGSSKDLFSGVIDDIIVDRRNKRVTIQCVDMLGWLNEEVPNAAIQQKITADTAITTILDAVNYPNIFRDDTKIETGIDSIPYWWTAGSMAKKEIEDVVNASMGFTGADGSGAIFHCTRRSTLTAPTWTEAHFEKDIKLTEPWENRRNIIDIRVTARQEEAAATIWEYAEQKRLAPGEEFEIWASFRYDGDFVPALNVQTPVFVFNARESGLGADIASDMTITTTIYADRMKIVAKNDGAVTGWIISASITGEPVDTKGVSRIIERATGWGTQPKPLYIDNDWLQDYNTASGFAEFLIAYMNRGQPYITVKKKVDLDNLFGDNDIFSQYAELYKRIDVDFDTLYIDAGYRIMSIEYNCGQSVNDVTATYKLQPAYNEPGTIFFRLGTSILGGSDILAW